MLAGLLALGHPARVIGIDVGAQPERVRADIGRVGRDAAVVWIHTGGLPGLFAYPETMARLAALG